LPARHSRNQDKEIAMKKLCMIGAVLASLAACGGSDNAPGQGGFDAFLAEVARVVGTTSETTEPIDIDALVATAPETTEPELLN
jgi:hypothetical protein